MTDPLNEALKEATLSVLLGRHNEPNQTWDNSGNPVIGIVSIESAFVLRIKQKASQGEFDHLIGAAMAKIRPEDVLEVLKGVLAEQILKGLEPVTPTSGYDRTPSPGWLQTKAHEIAVEACRVALSNDEALLDTLRAKIGSEVDRNRVGITVSLSDPEK